MKGGNMMGRCNKMELSSSFKVKEYTPDASCYEGLPRKGEADFLEKAQWELLCDRIVLDAHANKEPSMGDYLPDGMAKRYASIHRRHLPPLKPPHHDKPGLKGTRPPISLEKSYVDRFQNGRHIDYKRMVLDEMYREHIGPKMAAHITFTSDEEALQESKRNDAMQRLVEVYSGRSEVSASF